MLRLAGGLLLRLLSGRLLGELGGSVKVLRRLLLRLLRGGGVALLLAALGLLHGAVGLLCRLRRLLHRLLGRGAAHLAGLLLHLLALARLRHDARLRSGLVAQPAR